MTIIIGTEGNDYRILSTFLLTEEQTRFMIPDRVHPARDLIQETMFCDTDSEE